MSTPPARETTVPPSPRDVPPVPERDRFTEPEQREAWPEGSQNGTFAVAALNCLGSKGGRSCPAFR